MLEYSGQNCPAATACSYQHQVYHQTAGQFYSGNEGNLDFASFNSAHTDQHSVDPDSVTDDPEFVDPGNGDYTLGVSSPARDLGRHPDTDAVVDAGCYPLGYRVLGLEVA
jgi:hypothetical protein